jgi:hypothetical protein
VKLKLRDLLVSAALGSAAAYAQPQAVIAPSPSPAVSVAPLDPSDPVAVALSAGGRANLQAVSVVIKNTGTQPILGIVVLTTSGGPGGAPMTGRDVTDAFLTRGNPPVLQPGDSIVAIPGGGLHPLGQMAALAAGPGGSTVLQQASNWVGRAGSQMTVAVDAVVMASGEVDGPDTTNYMGELQQRRQAAESVLAAINGPSPADALSQMAAQRPQKGDWLGQWEQRWASAYLAASRGGSPANVLTAIQSNLTVPQLFRGATSATTTNQGENQ